MMDGFELERPEGYSDEEWDAYLEGAEDAANFFQHMAVHYASSAGEPEEQDDGVCGECGAQKIKALGREEKFCPECED